MIYLNVEGAASGYKTERDHDKGELDAFGFPGPHDDNATDQYTLGKTPHSLIFLFFFPSVWV